MNDAPSPPLQFTLKDLLGLMAVIAVALGGIPTAYKSPIGAFVMYVLIGAGQIALSMMILKRRPATEMARDEPSRQPYELAILGSVASLGTWLLTVVWLVDRWLLSTGLSSSAAFGFLIMICIVPQLVTFLVNVLGLLVMRGWVHHWPLTALFLLNIAATTLLPATIGYLLTD